MRKILIIPILLTLLISGCKKRIDEEVKQDLLHVPVAQVLEKAMGYLADGKFYTARKYFELIMDNAPNSLEFYQAKHGNGRRLLL